MIIGWKSKFNEMMIVAGLVNPIATIPQIVKLYATHTEHASGQSLTTWAAYTGVAVLWVIYGVINRQPALLIGYSLGAIMYGLVVLGILANAGFTF